MDGTVENCFASLLAYYDQFKRTKIIPADLGKIAKKYKSKPQQLILDLEKKYEVNIPRVCSFANITRICQVYSIPDSYLDLLPPQFKETNVLPYDPSYDTRSVLFDPEKVLNSERIISPIFTKEAFDNISKCKPLLSNFDGKVFKLEKKTVKAPDPYKLPKSTERTLHIFERIGLNSSSKVNCSDDLDNESLQPSPFALAYTFMKEKIRVRVIMRRHAGVGGILQGFLKAFDKHFNLLLVDADEEYSSVIKIPDKDSEKGKPGVNSYRVLKRHLPQLLVRGDNVILMGCASKNSYGFTKMKIRLTSSKNQTSIAMTAAIQRTAAIEMENLKLKNYDIASSSSQRVESQSRQMMTTIDSTDSRVVCSSSGGSSSSSSSSSSSCSSSSSSSCGFRKYDDSLHNESIDSQTSERTQINLAPISQSQKDAHREDREDRMLVRADTQASRNNRTSDGQRAYQSNREANISTLHAHDRFEADVGENRKRDSSVRDVDNRYGCRAPGTVHGSNSVDRSTERSNRGRENVSSNDECDRSKKVRREDPYRDQDVRREDPYRDQDVRREDPCRDQDVRRELRREDPYRDQDVRRGPRREDPYRDQDVRREDPYRDQDVRRELDRAVESYKGRGSHR